MISGGVNEGSGNRGVSRSSEGGGILELKKKLYSSTREVIPVFSNTLLSSLVFSCITITDVLPIPLLSMSAVENEA